MKHPPDRLAPDEPAAHDERVRAGGTQEGKIDQALADSFPASDAPPWTLGLGSPKLVQSQDADNAAADQRGATSDHDQESAVRDRSDQGE